MALDTDSSMNSSTCSSRRSSAGTGTGLTKKQASNGVGGLMLAHKANLKLIAENKPPIQPQWVIERDKAILAQLAAAKTSTAAKANGNRVGQPKQASQTAAPKSTTHKPSTNATATSKPPKASDNTSIKSNLGEESPSTFPAASFSFKAQLPTTSAPQVQEKLGTKRHHPPSPPVNLVAASNSNIIKCAHKDKEDDDMDLTHTETEKEDDDNNGYTVVVGKKMKTTHIVTHTHTSENTHASKQTKSERLPAINLRISDYKIKFNNENVVSNSEELDRCFPPEKHKLDIKFMKFASYDRRILVIATDDPDTHSLLSNLSNWPEDAFGRGVKPRHNRDPIAETARVSARKTIYSLSIRNVSQQIDVTSSVVKKALEQQGFTEARRTTNAKDDTPTSYVRLYTESKEVYDKHMYKGAPVILYHHPHKVVVETRPLQCYNCQGLGHIAFNCPDDEPTCMQCKGKHRFRNCPEYNHETKTYNKMHCANCDSSDHNSCSRKCAKIREHVKEREKVKAQNPPSDPLRHHRQKKQPQENTTTTTKPLAQQQQPQQKQLTKSFNSVVISAPPSKESRSHTDKQYKDLNIKVARMCDLIQDLLSFMKQQLPPSSELSSVIAHASNAMTMD